MIVRGGLLALPGEADFLRRDLRVRGERIAELSPSLAAEPGEDVVDASGLLVLPGAIDPHVHFDEPGFTHREDFLHGSSEAAKGGVTTVIDMPCTSLPPVTTRAALEGKLAAVAPNALVDFALYGGVSGRSVEESLGASDGSAPEEPAANGAMVELADKVVGFKCYFISGMESFTRVTHFDFARIIAEGERLGRPVLLHAEDFDYVEAASAAIARRRARRAAAGAAGTEWSDYLDSRPAGAELAAVATALALARGRERSLHIVHVSTAAAAQAIHDAGASCETCGHYLAFTEDDFPRLGAALKTAPPVKTRADREGLWRLLASGAIDFVASDHAPAPASEKETGDPLTAYGGIPGVGTTLPYLLSEGLLSRALTLPRFLDAVSGAAARRYGLSGRKGSIEVGKDADFVLVDEGGSHRVAGNRLLSKGRITPFEGMRFRGRILATYLRGVLVYSIARSSDESAVGDIVGTPGSGRFLTWGCR